MKITFDKGQMDKCFKEQDLVLVRKRKGTNDGLSRKLLSKVLPNDRYVVEDIPGAQRTQKFYTGVQSVSNLKHSNHQPKAIVPKGETAYD